MSPGRDRLDASVAALRELTAAATDGRASRARVLGALAARRRQRHRLGVAGLVAVLLLAIPGASAGLYHLGLAARRLVAPTRTMSPVEHPRLRPAAQVPAPPAIGFELDEASGRAPTETHADEEAAAPASRSPRLRPSSSRGLAGSTELDTYERAHRMHFHESSPRATLRGWNEYIARFPQGRFLPEAQFNRAICLVRLGDIERAREVLLRLTAAGGSDHPKEQAEKLLARLGQP